MAPFLRFKELPIRLWACKGLLSTLWRCTISFALCLGIGLGGYGGQAIALSQPVSLTASPIGDSTVADEVNALFDEAFAATSRGDFAAAESYWTQILEQYPHNAAVWSNRGNARVSQNKLKEAILDYETAIELAPDQPDPYLNRGTAREGLQDWQGAIADYNRVLLLSPEDPAAYNNRGNAEAGLGNWTAATEDYRHAVDLNGNFALARANYALALYETGDTQQAQRLFRNLVRRYPQFADMRAALAAALWVEGKQGEAESQWVSVVGLDRRYRDLDWVKTIRRWPPAIAHALEQFLSLEHSA